MFVDSAVPHRQYQQKGNYWTLPPHNRKIWLSSIFENNMYNKKVLESQSLIQEGQYEKGLEVLIQTIMGVNN